MQAERIKRRRKNKIGPPSLSACGYNAPRRPVNKVRNMRLFTAIASSGRDACRAWEPILLFFSRFPRTRRAGRRSIRVCTSPRHRNVTALRASSAQWRPVPRACMSPPRVMSPTRANPMSHATKPYDESRQRKSNRVNDLLRRRAAQLTGKATYVAKNVFSRHKSPRQNPTTRAERLSPS
jgi:hypothetical protein